MRETSLSDGSDKREGNDALKVSRPEPKGTTSEGWRRVRRWPAVKGFRGGSRA